MKTPYDPGFAVVWFTVAWIVGSFSFFLWIEKRWSRRRPHGVMPSWYLAVFIGEMALIVAGVVAIWWAFIQAYA